MTVLLAKFARRLGYQVGYISGAWSRGFYWGRYHAKNRFEYQK